jgi:hypothetical protein
MNVCVYKVHNLNIYCNRIYDALKRRYDCVSLKLYHFFIRNMPYNEAVTSTLSEQQAHRIRELGKIFYSFNVRVSLDWE